MIDKINHYSLTNPASVYDEEAMTALELAGRTAGKVNECVEQFNKLETETEEHLKKQDDSIPVEAEKAVQKFVDDGSFDEAISEYMGDIEQRLDNILKEGGDSTPELVDVRLGANGETYPTAGESVRAQMVELSDGMVKKNLIDLNALTAGYLQSTGGIHPSHQTGTFQRWEYTSDYIPVTAGLPYIISIKHSQERAGWYAFATYDANKNFIDRGRMYDYNATALTRKFTFPEGVAFVRVSYRSYMTDTVKFEQSPYATKHVANEPKKNLVDDYPLQFDGYIVDNGSVYPQTADGYISGEPALLEKYTRHIPVKAGEKYTLYHNADAYAWGAVGIYGEDGNAIQRITVSANKNEFIIPEGGVSIMLCARTYYLKDFALFKETTPMSAEQRAYENYLSMTSNNSTPTAITFDENVKSVNHRGYNTEAPENTLKAFKLSSEKGFKYVECDVRFTSDCVPVLLHDETIDRTSNGTGNISSLTFDAVRALDFGQGEKIPSFTEFLALCKSLGLRAYVEVKAGTEAQVKTLVGMVRMYGMRERVTFISFSSDILAYVKNADATARLGYILNTVDENAVNTAKSLKTSTNEVFLDVASNAITDAVVTLCVEADIPLEVWTVNNSSYITTMNPYITGVTSDNVHAGKVMRETFSGTMTPVPDDIPTDGGNTTVPDDTPTDGGNTPTNKYFVLGDTAYKYEEGMTWYAFINSENSGGLFSISRDTVCDEDGNTVVDEDDNPVKPDDVITDTEYFLKANEPSEPDTPSLITFTIQPNTYQAENGMTWAQWVESDYNTDGYYIDQAYIAVMKSGSYMIVHYAGTENNREVSTDEKIQNTTYQLSLSGDSGSSN